MHIVEPIRPNFDKCRSKYDQTPDTTYKIATELNKIYNTARTFKRQKPKLKQNKNSLASCQREKAQLINYNSDQVVCSVAGPSPTGHQATTTNERRRIKRKLIWLSLLLLLLLIARAVYAEIQSNRKTETETKKLKMRPLQACTLLITMGSWIP